MCVWFLYPICYATNSSVYLPVVEQLFSRAHEYANLANRAGAIATDLVLACDEFNMTPKDLRTVKTRTEKKKRSMSFAALLYPRLMIIHQQNILRWSKPRHCFLHHRVHHPRTYYHLMTKEYPSSCLQRYECFQITSLACLLNIHICGHRYVFLWLWLKIILTISFLGISSEESCAALSRKETQDCKSRPRVTQEPLVSYGR